MFGSLVKIVGSTLKWTFIVVLVLVAGHLVYWRGESVSDHVRGALEYVEGMKRPAAELMTRAGQIGQDLKIGRVDGDREKISAEERTRLRKVFHN